MKRMGLISLSLVAAMALVGCNNDNKKADATATASKASMCVACGQANGANPVMVSYKGATAATCCADCAKQFNALTDKEKDAKMMASMKK